MRVLFPTLLSGSLFASQSSKAYASCNKNDPQSMDGSCNNLKNPSQGASFTPYRRGKEGAEYEDDVSMKVTNRPLERVISNRLGAEDPATAEEDPIPHNMFSVIFGQFVNHDFENNDKVGLFVPKFVDGNATGVFAGDLLITEQDDFLCQWPDGFPSPPDFPPWCLTAKTRCLAECPAMQPTFIEYRPSKGSISEKTGQFEVNNRATSYLDLSTVYGNNDTEAWALREGKGGRLLTDTYVDAVEVPPNISLPFSYSSFPPKLTTTGLPTDPGILAFPPGQILTAGDFRVNENVALAAFHTLFLREHNYLANKIATKGGTQTDELIYQTARRLNIAQYQKIVLEEYLPAEFGTYFKNLAGKYKGYDSKVDATTGAAFAAAAFRYGHSSLRTYPGLGECGNITTNAPGGAPDIPFIGQIGGVFNVFGVLFTAGEQGFSGESFEKVIRGLISTITRPIDSKYTDEIRNIVVPTFSPEGNLGVDLLALDLQRGRNNGIPNYDRLRKSYHPNGSLYGTHGCEKSLKKKDYLDDPLACFLQLISGASVEEKATEEEISLANAMRDLYGKVNRVDAIIGILVEKKVKGTSFGETLGRIVVDQYKRARDGDRFWFENVFNKHEQKEIRKVAMKTLLQRHFNLPHLPEEVFLNKYDFRASLIARCNEEQNKPMKPIKQPRKKTKPKKRIRRQRKPRK